MQFPLSFLDITFLTVGELKEVHYRGVLVWGYDKSENWLDDWCDKERHNVNKSNMAIISPAPIKHDK